MIKSGTMIYNLAVLLIRLIPTQFLRWRTNSNDNDRHILYCEKIIIILSIILLYTSISVVFLYLTWKECTNIINILSNNNEQQTYYNKLFHRNNMYCNVMDGFLVFFLIIIMGSLFLNCVLGISYDYYCRYKKYKLSKKDINYDDKIIIHIPLYNEDYNTIKSTLDSISKLDYCMDNILLLIVVDGIINVPGTEENIDYTLLHRVLNNNNYIQHGLSNNEPITYKDNTLKIFNGVYNQINYSTIIKCGGNNESNPNKIGNRGKKDSALIIYESLLYKDSNILTYNQIIDSIENGLEHKGQYVKDYDYILIIDCDTDIESKGLNLLLTHIKNDKTCIAVCGQTIVKNKYENIITTIQYFEYFISHLLLKTYEHILYKVFVLSGCFTLMKINHNDSTLINEHILNEYTKESKTLYQKNLLQLGEDRYLTALLINEYPQNHIAYISHAKCFTNVPNNLKILLDQRRRWTNSLIACLLLMFKSPPKQSIIKHILMYIIIFTELFIIFILPLVIIIGLLNTIVSLTVQGFSILPLLITVGIILLNLIIAILTLKIDMILPFIPFLLSLPFFSIIIPLYSIINLDDLKWGLTRDTIDNNYVLDN